MIRLLHFCPLSTGGVAVNAHNQANAFCNSGFDVTLVCAEDWLHCAADTSYKQERILECAPQHGNYSRLKSRVLSASAILRNAKRCRNTIRKGRFTQVLFASYMEYLAPIWAPQFRSLSEKGVWFGVMALDPVRDYIVGPKWWHDWSVKAGYSFVDDAFVHHEIDLSKFGGGKLKATVVPHGNYPMPPASKNRHQMRRGLCIPEDHRVALCYGHLRDNKNLRSSIRAIADSRNVTLVVAGSEAAPGQTQSAEYQAYANEVGAQEKIRWVIGYQSDQSTANLFTLCDFALLPYDRSFVSTSGILHIAVPFRVPLIVACGDGALAQAVESYQLGVRMADPSTSSIVKAFEQIESVSHKAKFDRFSVEHSYERNAAIIKKCIENHHLARQTL